MCKSCDTPLEFYWQHFSTRNQLFLLYLLYFCYFWKIQIKTAFQYISNSSYYFYIFEPYKVVLINMIAILMSAKSITPGLVKINDSNYIVDVVMRLKFGNSLLQRFHQKQFLGVVLGQVQKFGTSTRHGLEFYESVAKEIKLKVR